MKFKKINLKNIMVKPSQFSKPVTLFIRQGCLIESKPIKITKKNFQTFKIKKQNKYKSKE
jgi:hypothetical protein